MRIGVRDFELAALATVASVARLEVRAAVAGRRMGDHRFVEGRERDSACHVHLWWTVWLSHGRVAIVRRIVLR